MNPLEAFFSYKLGFTTQFKGQHFLFNLFRYFNLFSLISDRGVWQLDGL